MIIASSQSNIKISAADPTPVRIGAGETVTIGLDSTPDAQFSWILTKDRKFQSAQRSRFFESRLPDVGTYILDVSIQDPVTKANSYKAFTIEVGAQTTQNPTLPVEGESLQAILKTEPQAAINNSVTLSPEGGMLKIDPSTSKGRIGMYQIDIDTSVDSNRDGDPANDFDNADTTAARTGNPMYYLVESKPQERRIKLTVTDALNTSPPNSTELGLVFISAPNPTQSSAASVPQQTNNGAQILSEVDGLTVSFGAAFDQNQMQGKELLFEWDFGDRGRSLLNTPIHTYPAQGTYTVKLVIRDIATGTSVAESTLPVQVFAPATGTTSSAASQGGIVTTSSAPSSQNTSNEESGFSLGSVMSAIFIIVILLAIAMGLYLLLTWIKKRTTSSIQQTLEKMENTIVKKTDTVQNGVSAEPMKLKKASAKVDTPPVEIIDKETSKPEIKKQNPETPSTSAGPVPAWLQKGSSQPAAKPAPTPAPVAAPKPAPAPAPQPKTAPPAPQAVVPKPAPAPAPKPATPAPAIAAVPKPATPIATPQPKVAPAPVAPKPQPPPPAVPVTASKPATPPPAAPVTPPKAPPAPVAAPKSAPAPEPKPQAAVPAPELKPVASTPAPTPKKEVVPAPVPQPKPVTATPKPAAPQAPKKAEPMPIEPLNPSDKSSTINRSDDDPPIAIIQADSLMK